MNSFYPKNGKDEAAFSKTESEIKEITGLADLESYRDVNNELLLWAVDVTDEQILRLKALDHFLLIEEDSEVGKVAMAVSFPVPTGRSSHIKSDIAKRNIEYSTQRQAPSDLVMVSQPT